MIHLEDNAAKEQLRALKKLNSESLGKRPNLTSGCFRSEPYEWIVFDNRSGNLWVGTWQHKGECLNWLDKNPG